MDESLISLSEYYEMKTMTTQQRMRKTDPSKYHYVSDMVRLDYYAYKIILQVIRRIRYIKYRLESSGFIISARELYILNQWIEIQDHDKKFQNTLSDKYYLNLFIKILNEVLFNEKFSRRSIT